MIQLLRNGKFECALRNWRVVRVFPQLPISCERMQDGGYIQLGIELLPLACRSAGRAQPHGWAELGALAT